VAKCNLTSLYPYQLGNKCVKKMLWCKWSWHYYCPHSKKIFSKRL
jgi:hypothetical protein